MNPRTTITNRLYVVLTLLALLPAAVAAQLVRIYVTDGPELRAAGERQASSHVEVAAMRGTILDRAGRTLAVNTARYQIELDPTVAGFEARAEELYAELARVTGVSAGTYRRRVANRASRQYVLLARSVDEAQREAVDALDVPGVIRARPRFDRRYTYGRVGAHVLGHVDPDLRGKAGVEVQYDEVLRGEPGRQTVQRDRTGAIRAVADGGGTEPQHGQELVLTLDLVLQSILQEELAVGAEEAGAAWATAVAMDPATGAVLAMANAPDYDPNRPGAASVAARRNHAVADQMEPGSTFKLVTAVAALEDGVATLSDSVETGAGWAVFGGRTMRDSHAYGTITLAEAIAKSSNVGLAKVGQRLDAGRFYQHARALGFGQPTAIDLPGEEGGTLHRPDTWSGSTQTSMSIGYGVSATPLQILTAYCALANGGLLVRPHVLAERRDFLTGRVLWRAPVDSVRRAFSAATADSLRPAFERVVMEGGTAPRAAVEGLRIAGKTGTARIAEGGRYGAGHRATFVGMFPADRPEVALVVVMDRPTNGYYGGTVAAPVFARVAERWTGVMPALAGRRAVDGARPAPAALPVPDATGLPQGIAAAQALSRGLAADLDGRSSDARWHAVTDQRPAAGETAPNGAVRFAAADEPARDVMPDLRGLSARRAAAWLARLGVAPRVQGAGVVERQEPAPGAALPDAATLTCTPALSDP